MTRKPYRLACPPPVCAASAIGRKMAASFVRFEMTPNAIDRLIALGWLIPESRRDPYAVTVALIKFGTQRSGRTTMCDGSLRYRGFYNRKK